MNAEECRTKILQILYDHRAQGSIPPPDRDDLAQSLGLSWDQIQHEVNYLEENKYIESKSRQFGARIFYTYRLTAKGVDLVEGRITDQSVYISGDWLQITVGDNASNLVLGKNITDIRQQISAEDTAGNFFLGKDMTDIKQRYDAVTDIRTVTERLDSTLHEFLGFLDQKDTALLQSEEIMAIKGQISDLRESLRKLGLLI